MKKRIFALFLSALLLTTVLCACGDEKSEEAGGIGSNGTSSSGEPVTGGELVVGISQDLGDSLDPYQMNQRGLIQRLRGPGQAQCQRRVCAGGGIRQYRVGGWPDLYLPPAGRGAFPQWGSCDRRGRDLFL